MTKFFAAIVLSLFLLFSCATEEADSVPLEAAGQDLDLGSADEEMEDSDLAMPDKKDDEKPDPSDGDVSLDPEVTEDVVAVVSTQPSADEIEVPRFLRVSATFNQPVRCDEQPGAANYKNAVSLIFVHTGEKISGKTECSRDKKAVYFYPDTPLLPKSRFTFHIEPGIQAAHPVNGSTPKMKNEDSFSFTTSRNKLVHEDFERNLYTWSCSLVDDSNNQSGTWQIGKPAGGSYITEARSGENVLATWLGLGYPDKHQMVYQTMKLPMGNDYVSAKFEFYAYVNFDIVKDKWIGVIPHILVLDEEKGIFSFLEKEPKLNSDNPNLIGEFTTREDLDYLEYIDTGLGYIDGADAEDILGTIGAVVDIVKFATTPVFDGIHGDIGGDNLYAKFWIDVSDFRDKEVTIAYNFINEDSQTTLIPGIYIDDVKIVAEYEPFVTKIEPQYDNTIRIEFSEGVSCSDDFNEPRAFDADNDENIYVIVFENEGETLFREVKERRVKGTLACSDYNRVVTFTPDKNETFSAFGSNYRVHVLNSVIARKRDLVPTTDEDTVEEFFFKSYLRDDFEDEDNLDIWKISAGAEFLKETESDHLDIWQIGKPNYMKMGYIVGGKNSENAMATLLTSGATLKETGSTTIYPDTVIKFIEDAKESWITFDAYVFTRKNSGKWYYGTELRVYEKDPESAEWKYSATPQIIDLSETGLVGEFLEKSGIGAKTKTGLRGHSKDNTYSRFAVDMNSFVGKEIMIGFTYFNGDNEQISEKGVVIDNLNVYSLGNE